MAVPNRPVSGAPIEAAWGDVVHDGVVALDIQSGIVNIVLNNTAISPVVVVTFPRPFASAPLVVATAINFSTSSVNHNVGVTATSPTTCSIGAREIREAAATGTLPVAWIAIGPRA